MHVRSFLSSNDIYNGKKGLSDNTLDAYERDLQKLLGYLRDENKDVFDVQLPDLQHFAATLHDIGIGPRSQCRILCGVRSFFRFMQTDGWRDDDPSELLESPVLGTHLPEVLSTREVDMLKASIDLTKWEGQRNRAIIETLFSCGLRRQPHLPQGAEPTDLPLLWLHLPTAPYLPRLRGH